MFEVKLIIRKCQDSPRVRVSGDLSLLVDNNVYCSELAHLLLKVYQLFLNKLLRFTEEFQSIFFGLSRDTVTEIGACPGIGYRCSGAVSL